MIKRTQGAALIMVLLISAILASISALLVIKTKQHTERIILAKEYMQAERDLISDLNHFIFVTQTSPYSIIGDNANIPFSKEDLPKGINLINHPFDYRKSSFQIQEMSGLIALSPLDEQLVTSYLKGQRWSHDQIRRFLDILKDWTDADILQRVNGAEQPNYNVPGYPLNQLVQSVKELGLLSGIPVNLQNKLVNDKNIIAYGAGRQEIDYSPDHLLPYFVSNLDADQIKRARKSSFQNAEKLPNSSYSSGNWIIKVNTGYGQAKSSKMLHLVRRFGGLRPFIISNWQERTE